MMRAIPALLALLLLACGPAAQAGWPCSIDHAYPEVASLSVENGELVAILGTRFFENKKEIEISGKTYEVFIEEYPRLVLSANGQWTHTGVVNRVERWDDSRQQCLDVPRDPEAAWQSIRPDAPLQEAPGDWFDQSVLSCTSDGQHRWGGITFYGGEGGWGVGGLVRQHLENGGIEFIRPDGLVRASTGPIAWFAGELWMGQTWFGECGGPAPGTGLKQLYYHDYSREYRVKEVPEVCGFAIRDFQEFDGALWIASELGLARLNANDGLEWTNYVPDLADPRLMREVECDALYAELLSSERFANTEGFDIGFAFEVFWDRLMALRPAFARRYLRELHGLED